MAELTITVAGVLKGTASNVFVLSNNLAGEGLTAGLVVYLKSTDSKWWKAQCDGTAEESGNGVSVGVTLHAALTGQPVIVQTIGAYSVGSTVLLGEYYVIGTTAGAIMPIEDLAATNKVTVLGQATSTTQITLAINASGIAHG